MIASARQKVWAARGANTRKSVSTTKDFASHAHRNPKVINHLQKLECCPNRQIGARHVRSGHAVRGFWASFDEPDARDINVEVMRKIIESCVALDDLDSLPSMEYRRYTGRRPALKKRRGKIEVNHDR